MWCHQSKLICMAFFGMKVHFIQLDVFWEFFSRNWEHLITCSFVILSRKCLKIQSNGFVSGKSRATVAKNESNFKGGMEDRPIWKWMMAKKEEQAHKFENVFVFIKQNGSTGADSVQSVLFGAKSSKIEQIKVRLTFWEPWLVLRSNMFR